MTLPYEKLFPGFSGHFIHSNKINIAYWEAKAGSAIPTHRHEHEMIVNILEGKLELTSEARHEF